MRTRSMLTVKFVTLNVMLIVVTAKLNAGESGKSETVRTNLEIMKELAAGITRDVIEQADITGNENIMLGFDEGENVKIFQDPVLETLKARGCSVFVGNDSLPSNRLIMHNSAVECRVKYDEMYRDGFLGTKRLKRNVTVSSFIKIVRESSGEVMFGKSLTKEYEDTVAVDDIPGLESTLYRSTHAEIPSETFIDRILEPVVIIGATGVIVYLFFHIRG